MIDEQIRFIRPFFHGQLQKLQISSGFVLLSHHIRSVAMMYKSCGSQFVSHLPVFAKWFNGEEDLFVNSAKEEKAGGIPEQSWHVGSAFGLLSIFNERNSVAEDILVR